MYFSHNSNIKYVNFEPIYYAINLDVVSFSMIFSEFDSIDRKATMSPSKPFELHIKKQ